MSDNTATQKKDPARLTIGTPEFPVRFSYLYPFEAQESEDDDGNKVFKYSTQIIIDKRDTATKKAIDAAIKAVIDADCNGKMPPNFKLPLRDGDEEWEEKGEAVKGCWFFNCSSKKAPQVVGTERDIEHKLIRIGEDDIKSGDYGRISINLFTFGVKKKAKSKGIGIGMGNIQKLKDGEPLGNTRSADDDFGDLEEGFQD